MKRKYIITKYMFLGVSLLLFWYGYEAAYGNLFDYNDYVDPICFLSLSLIISIVFTLFISNDVFKKWLIYFFIWFITDVLWILSADTTSDYFGLTPTKETASIYMGFILVYTSLIWFILSKFQWQTSIKWIVSCIITIIIFIVYLLN